MGLTRRKILSYKACGSIFLCMPRSARPQALGCYERPMPTRVDQQCGSLRCCRHQALALSIGRLTRI